MGSHWFWQPQPYLFRKPWSLQPNPPPPGRGISRMAGRSMGTRLRKLMAGAPRRIPKWTRFWCSWEWGKFNELGLRRFSPPFHLAGFHLWTPIFAPHPVFGSGGCRRKPKESQLAEQIERLLSQVVAGWGTPHVATGSPCEVGGVWRYPQGTQLKGHQKRACLNSGSNSGLGDGSNHLSVVHQPLPSTGVRPIRAASSPPRPALRPPSAWRCQAPTTAWWGAWWPSKASKAQGVGVGHGKKPRRLLGGGTSKRHVHQGAPQQVCFLDTTWDLGHWAKK